MGITLFTVDLFLATNGVLAGSGAELIGLREFLTQPSGWRVLTDLLLVSISGGIYIVPLYALLQERSEPAHRARNIASNNVINAMFMVVAAAATAGMLELGFAVPRVFLVVGLANEKPYAYIETDGTVTGAIIEVLRAALKPMGIDKIEANINEFSALVPGLFMSSAPMPRN